MAVSGWSSVSRRRRISSAFSNSGWAWAYFPWASRLHRQVVVAGGGVGVVVGEQAAADLQRLLEQRLGLGVLPLGVEVGRQVVVAGGGVGVVVGEQAAADLQRLLEQRLGLGVLPLGVEVRSPGCCSCRRCRGGRR